MYSLTRPSLASLRSALMAFFSSLVLSVNNTSPLCSSICQMSGGWKEDGRCLSYFVDISCTDDRHLAFVVMGGYFVRHDCCMNTG